MYTAQITKDRIKKLSKDKKLSMDKILSDCSLGANAIRQISDEKGLASFSLAKIADYLDCSVDYLLGRTDQPEFTGFESLHGDNENYNKVLYIIEQLNDSGLKALHGAALSIIQEPQYKKTAPEQDYSAG